jgi:DNA-binding response OmpR family regulator
MNAKVLIVEDEISLARTLLDRLRKEGDKVEIASNGNLGMELTILHRQGEAKLRRSALDQRCRFRLRALFQWHDGQEQ